MFEQEKTFTVSEFNALLKGILNELGFFSISGEITELSITSKKGVYMTISDGKANLRLSGYQPTIKGIDLIQKGMKVIVSGYCDIYVPYGSFSLSINKIEPEGEGALAVAYEKLKKLLAGKGYFDPERKKQLPEFVTRIALLTGKNSAAYSDFVKILKEHTSSIEVDFYPVIVQGENSVTDILKAFDKVQAIDYDLVVLTRGGGSLEDLKSFNDPDIADVIFKSRLPVLVAVGHEKDESIADFVADRRASTPSQAAYYISKINEIFVENQKERIEGCFRVLRTKIDVIRANTESKDYTIFAALSRILENIKSRLEFYKRLLKSFDTSEILARGFCILQKDGKRVRGVVEVAVADNLLLKLHDGSLGVKVEHIKPN